MSITIQVSPNLEQQLRREAAQRGLGIGDYVTNLLERTAASSPVRKDVLPKREAELLQAINQAIPADIWPRYDELVSKREQERINAEELTELMMLTDRMEAANVARIQHLIALAALRCTTLSQLMQDLGIQPRAHA